MRIRRTVGSLQGATAMLAYFQVPLTWTALLKRTARETQSDNGAGLAAQLPYYFFPARFPRLLSRAALHAGTGQFLARLRSARPARGALRQRRSARSRHHHS